MIEPSLIGDRKIISIFDELDEKFHGKLVSAVRELTGELTARVEANLAGAVSSRTGQTAGSIRSEFKQGKDYVKGKVLSSAGAKAVALEYGATGRKSTAVKGYSKRLDHAWSRQIAPITVNVPPYQRTQNIAPHPFMRPAIESMQSEIVDRLRAATETTVAETNAEMAR